MNNMTIYLMLGAAAVFILLCIVGAALVSGSRYDDAHGYDEVP